MTAAPQILTVDQAVAELGEDAVRRGFRHQLWRKGDLSYRFSDLQLRVREMIHEPGPRRCGWLASRRAGKSRTASGTSAEKGYAMPGIYIPYAAPSAVQVATFIDPHFRRIANEAPDDLALDHKGGQWETPPLQWYDAAGNPVRTKMDGGVELARFRGSKHEEVMRQSIIRPRGCDETKKADALRGPGTAYAVVDEARDIPILDYVLTDVLGPMLWEARSVWGEDVVVKLFVCTTAPRRPDHPFVEVWEGLKATGAAIHSDIYQADHLTDEDIAEARDEAGGEDTLSWRREALALIERDPRRAVFPEFDRAKHVREVERPSHIRPCIIGDGGHEDMTVFGFGYYHFPEATYVIEDELVFRRTRSDVIDAAVAAKERELWPDTPVDRRRVDFPPQVRADMNREEWGDPHEWGDDDRDPPHWLGVTKPRGRPGEGSFQAGVNRVRTVAQRQQLAVHPRCTTLIEHAENARWNVHRSDLERVKDEEGEPLHHYDGAADLVYFVRDCDATTNPIPDVPEGVGLPTHIIREARKQQSQGETLRRMFGRGSKRRRR